MRRILIAAMVAGLLTACGTRPEEGGTATTTPVATTAPTAGGPGPGPGSGGGQDPVPASPSPGATESPVAGDPSPNPAAAGEAVSASPDEIVRRMFPDATQVVAKDLDLGGHTGEDLEKTLGAPLEGHDKTSPALVATSADGRSLGAAWMTDAHVGPDDTTASVAVGMDLDRKIRQVVVIGAQTPSGFLESFRGKTVADLASVPAPDETQKAIAESVRRAAIVLQDGLIAPPAHTH